MARGHVSYIQPAKIELANICHRAVYNYHNWKLNPAIISGLNYVGCLEKKKVNCYKMHLYEKKSRIRETLNLSTDADHRTNIFFVGDGKKKN